MNKRFLIVLGLLIGSMALIFSSGALLSVDVLQGFSDGNSSVMVSESNVQKALAAQLPCPISSTYPQEVLQWCDLITTYARQYDLDPDLVAALILQESGGNATAYSKSGAVGLMQVMPRDGLAAEFMCPNGPCFAKRPSMAELYDPAFNVEYGTRFLSGLVSRYGNTRDALKAYGPANVGYYYADIVLAIFDRY